jgi:hypothetical protein
MLVSLAVLPLAAAPKESRLSFRASLGTAGITYGSRDVKDFFDANPLNRLVLALDGGIDIEAHPSLRFTLGMVNTFDYNAGNGKYLHIYDGGIATGIRFYPLPNRLALSAEYIIGKRWEFIGLNQSFDGTSSNPPRDGFSNGFRLGTEVTLGYLTHRVAPIAGLSWRYMPRHNGEADSSLTVSLTLRIHRDRVSGGNRR